MNGVAVPPIVVRGKSEQTGDYPKGIICRAGFKKRTMSTVMKNNENANQESRRWDSEQNGEPVGNFQAAVHSVQQEQVRNEGTDYLPGAAGSIWSLIWNQNPA
jgi:hypothetical protein